MERRRVRLSNYAASPWLVIVFDGINCQYSLMPPASLLKTTIVATLFLLAPRAWAHMAGYEPNPHPFEQSSDYTLDVETPGKTTKFPAPSDAFGQITSAAQQPAGALTGRIVFMTAGHGWMYDPGFSPPWRVMRPSPLNGMNEDYGNVDQLSIFANYCFNAGAIVVPFRPVGHQTNEVVLNNISPNVSWAGTWSDSTDSVYFGKSTDAVRYRFATMNAAETATATYTPNIPRAGFYPIYTWVRHGSNRGNQLYRIRHTGGESQIRIPHHMVGNGWVYLGEYYFNAGSNALSGAVVISNLRGSTQGSVVIADGIRFGNGMGSVIRGGGVSDYPREDECARYWVEAAISPGQSSSLYNGGSSTDDESDAWYTPPRMSAEMNNSAVNTNRYHRVYMNFHSNAANTTARGTTALVNNNTSIRTLNQLRLAQITADMVDHELISLGSPPMESAWGVRGTVYSSQNYTEISNDHFNDEMDATMLEVAFHDNTSDAALMRDSKVRGAVARATVHSIIKFFHEFDGLATNYFPECPSNVRAITATNGNITLTWTAPGTGAANGFSHAATNYVIYRSTNGFGFGNPVSAGNVTSYTISNLAPNIDYYFQIAAANAGGESMPSEVVGCRVSTTSELKILYVNAFDRFDRTTNLRQDTARQNWDPPGPTGGVERVWPRNVNAFNYVVPHGKAIAAYGAGFDTCQNELVGSGTIALGNYDVVIWAAGQESTTDETFNANEQTRVTAFLNAGGHLFASGSEIGWDLDRASGPSAGDRTFYNTYLHADFGNNTNDDSAVYTTMAVTNALFTGRSNSSFDNGNNGIYWVQNPDILTAFGAGSAPILYYNNTTNVAAIRYLPATPAAGRVVYFGFPFETITSVARQANYMEDILDFFTHNQRIFFNTVTTKTYGNVFNLVATVSSGLPVTFSVVSGPAVVSNNVVTLTGTGSVTIRASQAGDAHFNAAPDVDRTFTVSKALITVTAQNQTKVYGEDLPTLTYAYSGLVGGDDQSVITGVPVLATTATAASNVSGSPYPITVNISGLSAANYTFTNVNATLAITKAPLVVTANNTNRTYGAANVFSASYSGFVLGQDASVVTGAPNFSTPATTNSPAGGPYVVTPVLGTLAAANYSFSFVPGSLMINKAGLSVRADNKTRAYGAVNPAFSVTYTGLVNNQTPAVLSGLPELTVATTTNSTVAGSPYPIGVALGSLASSNYDITNFVAGELTIVPAALTISVDNACRVTGATNPALTGTIVGVQNGEDISATYQTTASPADGPGNYPITLALIDPAGKLPNYLVTTNAGNFKVMDLPTISAAPTNQLAEAGSNATFQASITNGAPFGAEPLMLQWKFQENDIPGATNSILVVPNVAATNVGAYTIVASNCAGSATASATLMLKVPLLISSFTFSSNQIHLLINAQPGSSHSVEVSTDLVEWHEVTNFNSSNTVFEFFDLLTNEQQFYRVLTP